MDDCDCDVSVCEAGGDDNDKIEDEDGDVLGDDTGGAEVDELGVRELDDEDNGVGVSELEEDDDDTCMFEEIGTEAGTGTREDALVGDADEVEEEDATLECLVLGEHSFVLYVAGGELDGTCRCRCKDAFSTVISGLKICWVGALWYRSLYHSSKSLRSMYLSTDKRTRSYCSKQVTVVSSGSAFVGCGTGSSVKRSV